MFNFNSPGGGVKVFRFTILASLLESGVLIGVPMPVGNYLFIAATATQVGGTIAFKTGFGSLSFVSSTGSIMRNEQYFTGGLNTGCFIMPITNSVFSNSDVNYFIQLNGPLLPEANGNVEIVLFYTDN